MARYKKTSSVTHSGQKYPDVVTHVNEIAKELNRPVHDVSSEILLNADAESLRKRMAGCQGENHAA